MGVGSRESEFELARSLADHQAAYGHTTQVHLELARPGLDGQRERSSCADGKLVAGDAAKGSRDALPGWLGLDDADITLLLDYPRGSLARRVVADARNPGFSLTWFGSEAAGSQSDP